MFQSRDHRSIGFITEAKDPYEIYDLNSKILPEKYPIEYITELMINFPNLQLVYVTYTQSECKTVGYILGYVDSDNNVCLSALGILKEFRSQGIGRKLINQFLENVRDHVKVRNINSQSIHSRRASQEAKTPTGPSGGHTSSSRSVYLHVKIDNTNAIKLYKSIGFKIIELIPNYYSDNSDAYLMKYRLT